MKKILLLSGVLLWMTACQTKEKLNVNFTVSPTSIYAGMSVNFQAVATGGTGRYIYQWTVGDEIQEGTGSHLDYQFYNNGVVLVTLYAMDSDGDVVRRIKAVEIKPAKDPEYGTLKIEWVARMNGYNSISTAAVADDGSVYTTCRDNYLYKWSSTGANLWARQIFKPKANQSSTTLGTPSIDSDGTVYIGAGSGNEGAAGNAGDGTFKAFNPNGSEKWSFSGWWRASGTPAPTCTGTIAAIDDENVYFGCTGQNGIVTSVKKTTGARNGFAAPVGGVRTGLALTKSGMVVGGAGQYGIFGIGKTTLDQGGNDLKEVAWMRFRNDGDENFPTQMNAHLACLNVGGVDCVAGVAFDYISTKVYCLNAATGEPVSVCRIDDTGDQEQGGVVVDAAGNLVASLSCAFGDPNGGIVVVNPANGEVVSRFKTYEKVSGSPAVDDAGNIHFGTEGEDDKADGMGGSYYIIKPKSGTTDCDLLVKRDLADLIREDGRFSDFVNMSRAKIWSSPVIGDDGRIYVCFTEGYNHDYSGVVCMRFDDEPDKGIVGCHAPADSQWPMLGGNRRHTYKQK